MRHILVFMLIAWWLMFLPLVGFGEKPRGEVLGLNASPGVKINVTQDREFGNLPLYFIPNHGQVSEKARFYARTQRYTLWLTAGGMVFDSVDERKRVASHLVFLHSNRGAEIVAEENTTHTVNILKGKDAKGWYTGLPTSKAVLYKEIYHGIDLRVYGVEKQIEYDWIVKPGGDPGEICFFYQQVLDTGLDEKGNLLVKTRMGDLVHQRPVAYQVIGERRVNIPVAFKKINTNIFGLEVGTYDKKYELIIDPIVYSTYLGGSGEDNVYGLTVDRNGCAYLTGSTYSMDFPDSNWNLTWPENGKSDIYVTKFSVSGKSLLYSTIIGGSDNEIGEGIQVDSNGLAYVIGHTQSADFPLQGAYQNTNRGNTDAVVFILGSTGQTLQFSTFLGGKAQEKGFAIALDSNRNIYVVGVTASSDFPIKNGFDSTFNGGSADAFVAKFSSGGASLTYSTFLGGTLEDAAYGIAVKGTNAYVVGRTNSSNFPRQSMYQDVYGGGRFDVFVTKLSSAGSSLVYSTFLGGDGNDSGWGIAVGSDGKAYVVGNTDSSNFPTINAYQSTMAGVKDAFITCFSSTGTILTYSTYLGGSEADMAAHVEVNQMGNAYMVGSTMSSNFPVKNSNTVYVGGYDTFTTMFDSRGGSLIFSGFHGGSNDDSGKSLALSGSGDMYIAGITDSSDLPTESPYQSHRAGGKEAFVAMYGTSECGTLCGAVENCDLTWTTGGDSNWYEQSNVTCYDGDALQSGVIGNNQSTYIQTVVSGPGTLTFCWRVSSSYSDYLNFYMDGEFMSGISGYFSSQWKTMVVVIPEGNHTLKWAYVKDSNYSAGSDCGWLDHVVYSGQIYLGINRDALNFGCVTGQSTGTQTFAVEVTGNGTYNWTTSSDQSWLRCSPATGTNNGVVSVDIDAEHLPVGTYNGLISVTCPSASNSPQTVSVTLKVYNANQVSGPFGDYATPLNGSTISSSVPFTGWALDDVGVLNVKLYVDMGGGVLLYIGDAAFVEGARPDVEQSFPGYPNCYKAGWGYMMLTNYLPNGGNGTYIIKAIATDMDGHQTVLGSKTVFVDNVNAVKPFGAIDTPTPGGTASGSRFLNWGWVLTPQPNKIPTDGSTISVYVDGVNLGHPYYNLYRVDIATYFPNYANSGGAVGYFYLDTTAFENGVHSIQWVASDNAGNTDGIGSRYFSIQGNSGSRQERTANKKMDNFKIPRYSLVSDISDTVKDNNGGPVIVRRGFQVFNEDREKNILEDEVITPDEKGVVQLELKELERVEIQLEQETTLDDQACFVGWLVVGEQLKPLPIGSSFDGSTGIFQWIPGPGFVGEYRLIFVKRERGGYLSYRSVVVDIHSKY